MKKVEVVKIPVVVTTKVPMVVFGYIDPGERDKEIVRVERARMCVYWSQQTHGVFGLAANGPVAGCRIGPEVPGVTLSGVTCVIECSAVAVDTWGKDQWS